MSKNSHGHEKERQVREIAARLGVADFIYSAPPVAKGAAFREASGDGLLIVGTRGAVLQVKARDPAKQNTDISEKAIAWTRKQWKKALSQGQGSRREIARRAQQGLPLVVTPVRAAHLPKEVRNKYDLVLSEGAKDWPTIVVLDHSGIDGFDLGFHNDAVCLTMEDWQRLHQRLRSVSATLTYVDRVLANQVHVPLGYESNRYSMMYQADDQVSQSSDPSYVSFLVHPNEVDVIGTDIFHDIIDKVWPDDGVIPWSHPDQYRRIVEFLDVVPPGIQGPIGRWFLRRRAEIADGKKWASGIAVLNHSDRLIFACAPIRCWNSLDDLRNRMALLTTVRHNEALETGAPAESVTLAVVALVEDRPPKTGVVYFFILLSGAPLYVPPELRASIEKQCGVFDHQQGTVQLLPLNR